MVFVMWVTLIFQFFSLLGLGMALSQWMNLSGLNIFEKAVVGLFSTAVLGLLLHFFVPLALPLTKSIFYFGLFFSLFYGLRSTRISISVFFFLIISFFITLGAFQENPYSDTGLYHYPAMIWASQEKIVFGLANLYGPYAHQSIWFTLGTVLQGFHFALFDSQIIATLGANLSAMLSGLTISSESSPSGFTPETSGFLINALIVSLGLSTLIDDTYQKKKFSIYSFVCLGFLFTFLRHSIFAGLGSPSTDVPVGILGILTFRAGIDYFQNRNSPPSNSKFAALCVLLFLSLGTKLSLVPISFLALGGLSLNFANKHSFKEGQKQFWVWLKENKIKLRYIFGFLFFPLLLVSVRSFVQSGCFIYPFEKSCVSSVAWAHPWQEVKEAREDVRIYSAGLSPEEVSIEWKEAVKLGVDRNKDNLIFSLSLLSIFIGLLATLISSLLAFLSRSKIIYVDPYPILLLLSVCGAGILFWLSNAPHIRFGFGFLWPAFGLCALAIQNLFSHFPVWRRILTLLGNLNFRIFLEKRGKVSHLFIGSSLLFFYFILRSPHLYSQFSRSLSLSSEWPRFPEIPYEVVSTQAGKEILRPTYSDKCWKLPQPCSKFVDKGLIEERRLGYLILKVSFNRPWVRNHSF